MTKIFISYRREDAGFAVDQIHQALQPYAAKPEDIFVDIDNIPPGHDFADYLMTYVEQCDVMLAAIGLRWLEAKDPDTGSRRLDNPQDFVRIEIESALARDIPVVPLLLGGAKMPTEGDLPEGLKPLARRQAVQVERGNVDFAVEKLMRRLGIGGPDAKSRRQKKGSQGLFGIWALIMIVILAGAGAFWAAEPLNWKNSASDAVADIAAQDSDVTLPNLTAIGDEPAIPDPSDLASSSTEEFINTFGPWDGFSSDQWSTASDVTLVNAVAMRGSDPRLIDAARAGNANAMVIRALIFIIPEDQSNAEIAVQLLSEACSRNQMRACHNLAKLHESGFGTSRNEPLATQLAARACVGGIEIAC